MKGIKNYTESLLDWAQQVELRPILNYVILNLNIFFIELNYNIDILRDLNATC